MFVGLQHHHFSRSSNHVGRCRLLLSNYSIQPINRNSTWYMANWKPLHPPHPLPSKIICNCKNVLKLYTPNSVNIKTLAIIGAANMVAHFLPLYWCNCHFSTNALVVSVTVAPIYSWKHVSCKSVPPIGKELQRSSTKNHISQIFLILAAPMH